MFAIIIESFKSTYAIKYVCMYVFCVCIPAVCMYVCMQAYTLCVRTCKGDMQWWESISLSSEHRRENWVTPTDKLYVCMYVGMYVGM